MPQGQFDWGPWGGIPPKQEPIYEKEPVIPGETAKDRLIRLINEKPPDVQDPFQGTITIPGIKTGSYTGDPNQFSPNQRYPVADAKTQGDYTDQLVPTSQNIRNNTLQDLLQDLNRPGESAKLGQLMASASDKRAMGSENAYATAAARGLGSSGMLERVLRSNNLDYVKDVADAQNTARDTEQNRQLGLTDQINNLVNTDIDFWRSLSAGRNAALRRPIYNLGQGSNVGAFGRASAGAVSGAGGGATFPSSISYGPITDRPGTNSGSPYGFNTGYGGSPNYFGGGNVVPNGDGTGSDEFGTRFSGY